MITPTRTATPRRWVMLASELYALAILRPVAAAAQARGDRVMWLATDAVAAHLSAQEARVGSSWALWRFRPQAVFATVNRIPPFLPGLQVQLFHGLNLHKRDPAQGQFRILGLFDLYCSHGPATTGPLRALALRHRDFTVSETGWPKLDGILPFPGPGAPALRAAAGGRPVVMYASTFNEPLSQARACLPVLEALIARGDRYWLLTLHPMAPADLRRRYEALSGPHARFVDSAQLTDLLQAADVLVCDTSSVVEEFMLLDKPVITINHRQPQSCMLDLRSPHGIDGALAQVLADPAALRAARHAYVNTLHPARDGRSAERVLDAVEARLTGKGERAGRRVRPLLRRPWRSWKQWRTLLPGGSPRPA